MSIEPEYIDFDVIKEDWNLYKIEDGTILKLKLVFIKVIREGVDSVGNPIYSINSQNVVGIIPPKELMGPPSNRSYTPQEIADSIVKEDLKFEVIREDWNEYKLKDGTTLYIKPVVTMVSRTSLFDRRGEPIYNVQSQIIIKERIPKELRKNYENSKSTQPQINDIEKQLKLPH